MAQEVVPHDVILPCGWMDREEQIHRDAQIIPMTARVRVDIARPEVRSNPVKVVDAVLLSCVKKIGPVGKITRSITDQMLTGDRDFLVAEIRKISMGNIVTVIMNCSSCGQKLEVPFDISTAPVLELQEGKYEVINKARCFKIDDDGLDIHAVFRYPTGKDQYAVAHILKRNPVEANIKMYRSCLVEWNGMPVAKTSARLFDDLSLPALDFLDEQFIEMMPGPGYRDEASCPGCGVETNLSLETSDFLFPLPKGRRPTVQ